MSSARSAGLVDKIIDEMGPFMAQQRHKWAAQCHAYGLSMTHLQVLGILDDEGPTPMGQLADELGVGVSNVSGIVGRLEEKGVVARVHDETDRRMVHAELTPAGMAMLQHVEETRLQRMRRLVETLSSDEQRTVLRALKTLTAAHQRVHAGPDDHHSRQPHGDKEPLHV